MAELIPTAGEAEWLEARRKGVTASEIAVIMGLSPYSSPYALYHQKLGILPPDGDQAVFERGRVLEPYVAEKFAEAHEEFSVYGTGRELYAHSDRPWQLATPDRLLDEFYEDASPPDFGVTERERLAAVLECKTDAGSDEWGEPGTDEVPVHYRCQVLWQMDVMGVSRAYVSCLDPARWAIREYVIEHGNCFATEASERIGGAGPCHVCRDQALMRREGENFLFRIEVGAVPDVDWRPATIGALKALNPDVEDREAVIGRQLAISYRAAVKHAKAAEQRKDEMTARLLLAMGNAKRATEACTDKPVATRSVSHPKRIDTERLRTEQPAIAAEYTKPPKPEVKLTPAKPKKDKKSVSADSE